MESEINISSFNFNDLKIVKHKNYIKLLNINIDRELSNTSIINFKKKYYSNKTTKIFILGNENIREVILIGDKNILINYSQINMFDNIYLPEIIDFYLKYNNKLDNELEKKKDNSYYYSINNNLYILNIDNNLLTNIKEYLHKINKKNKYKLEISKDYVKEDIVIENNKNKIYSYGYINILFIAFIITIATIIFCLFKY